MEERDLFRRGRFGPAVGRVADGVWLVRGGFRRAMNVYLLEQGEGRGVVQFDAGTASMAKAVRAAAAALGGVERIVLGHAHCDHRGSAPGVGAPVYCHLDAVTEAEDPASSPPYFSLGDLEVAPVRWLYPLLLRAWDGGAVKVSGTVAEGDAVAGFEVIELSGHAPGMIGLWRLADRLALVSDTVYLVDSARLRELEPGAVTVPHRAFNQDTEQARAAVRKLAALEPLTVCAGHEEPLRGPDLRERLEAAAAR